ncbi:MAG: pyridoxal-dependent decarboxylase [Candidatus Kapabacteria bacterium]|nr:pyridoxal-dependent decarboxylase [Candidatus Kapabacteria bacterium]
MTNTEFKKYGYQMIDRLAQYFDEIENYPVKSNLSPGDIKAQLPQNAPEMGENFDDILADFEKIILPGITHWQSPSFHAYFPANNSFPSILAELLSSGLGLQCMVWATSPAAAELEETVMNWLRDAIGLPNYFSGVIQDTASTATLCAILSARERHSDYQTNIHGISNNKYTVYCSVEAHSSIEKAVKIAGLGSNCLRKIPVRSDFSMDTVALSLQIDTDVSKGYIPLAVIGVLGTTSSLAFDNIAEINRISKQKNIWVHVDAAHAGSAFILEEYRYLIDGIDGIDSFVFNPHKWLFTNFDCSAYFVSDKECLTRTFEIMPEYLKTGVDKLVNNYRDWGIQLGRRFRALKLWFVIRSYGMEGLRQTLRKHIEYAQIFKARLSQDTRIEILAPVTMNLICFRLHPVGIDDESKLSDINNNLLNKLNDSGKVFLTHTKLDGKYTLRAVFAQTNLELTHVEKLQNLIFEQIEI